MQVWINKESARLFVVIQMYWDHFILVREDQSMIIISGKHLVKYYERVGNL